MVTDRERKLILLMVRVKFWRVEEQMRLPWIRPTRFTWLLVLLKRRQQVDNLHHAPCCPANHYHRMRLVFHPCTCGTTREMRNG